MVYLSLNLLAEMCVSYHKWKSSIIEDVTGFIFNTRLFACQVWMDLTVWICVIVQFLNFGYALCYDLWVDRESFISQSLFQIALLMWTMTVMKMKFTTTTSFPPMMK